MSNLLTIFTTHVGPTERLYPWLTAEDEGAFKAPLDPKTLSQSIGRQRSWRVIETVTGGIPQTLQLDGSFSCQPYKFRTTIELVWSVVQWLQREVEPPPKYPCSQPFTIPIRSTPAGYARVHCVQVGRLHDRATDLWNIKRIMNYQGTSNIQYLQQARPQPIWSNSPISLSRNQCRIALDGLTEIDKAFADKLVKV